MNGPDAAAMKVEKQILQGTTRGQKDYRFDDQHDPNLPVQFWFQESDEGGVLFVVFYSQACRWSRCLGCNLPARMSRHHVGFRPLMAQIDHVFLHPHVTARSDELTKLIVSNNGSVLDEKTFSSTALMYLVARANIHLPRLAVLSLETRVEYVEVAELEFLARALQEGQTPTVLELAVGLEAFDDHIRNEVFLKGLRLLDLERLCRMLGQHGFRLKCYFMQKPVPGMSDEDAVQDVQRAIDYLARLAETHGVRINLHLNPTYVAYGTAIEDCFRSGEYTPPRLQDVARAVLYAEGKAVSVFVGLSDEGLACAGGSFIRPGEEALLARLEHFNRTQDFGALRRPVGAS